MRKKFWNHGSTRMRGANACAFVRIGALRQFEKGRALAKAIRVIRGLMLAMSGVAVIFPIFAAEPTVSVSAQQRYPWNGMVDVAFTITGESGTKYDTSFVARDVAGGTNLTMKTIYRSDGSAAALTNQLAAGSSKWVWNAAADLPSGFNCERVKVDVSSEAHVDPLYMIIDVSSGSSAKSYSVSYLDNIPSGGWANQYKDSRIVLRRITKGSFTQASTRAVSITKDFWIGIFEITAKQYTRICGSVPSGYYYASSGYHPVAFVSYNTIRGKSLGAQWPSSDNVDASSFLGKLRARTGLLVDLPTEAQWEYAARSGSGKNYCYGSNLATSLSTYAVYGLTISYDGIDYTSEVGSKQSNNWGIYDVHGNIAEWCRDWYGDLGTTAVSDPKGPTSGTSRVIRGGWCGSNASACNFVSRDKNGPGQGTYYGPDYTADVRSVGFRIIIDQ